MSEDKLVWLLVSESVENRIRTELNSIPVRIVGFRDVCDAIELLRNSSQKPSIIIGNYAASDIMLEVAHQKEKYAGIRTVYASEEDLSHLAKSHNADYLILGKDGKIDRIARLVRPP